MGFLKKFRIEHLWFIRKSKAELSTEDLVKETFGKFGFIGRV